MLHQKEKFPREKWDPEAGDPIWGWGGGGTRAPQGVAEGTPRDDSCAGAERAARPFWSRKKNSRIFLE